MLFIFFSLSLSLKLSWLFIEFGTGVWHLYVARFLAGFAGGGSFIVVPIFVTEIADDHVRGLFGSLTVLSHNLGIVISYVACSYVDYFTVPYFGVGASILFFVWCLTIPDSPKYLMEKGQLDLAGTAWEYFHDTKFTIKDHEMHIGGREKLSKKDFCKSKWCFHDDNFSHTHNYR